MVLIFLLFFFCGSSISEISSPEMIVWNVGQGQWVTSISSQNCLHFDMGGEKMDWKQLRTLCGHRQNKVFLSHWDLDHIGFIRRASSVLKNICLALPPQGEGTESKKKLIKAIPNCRDTLNDIKIITPQNGSGTKMRSNDLSHVVVHNTFLIPGDSTGKMEKIWAPLLENTGEIRHLILGHHGSRTSTSGLLLKALPSLRQAFASARKKRYGHPHDEVIQRLKQRGVSLLPTEIWGNIHLAISPQ